VIAAIATAIGVVIVFDPNPEVNVTGPPPAFITPLYVIPIGVFVPTELVLVILVGAGLAPHKLTVEPNGKLTVIILLLKRTL
jgi:hypothetical protein